MKFYTDEDLKRNKIDLKISLFIIIITMENLITCSRVLYDKDISDKMEEITSLKRKIHIYETPKIEYSNLEEWETKTATNFRFNTNNS